MNFVYAFDNNYNLQGFIAIKSLLDNVDKSISIHILHSDPETFDDQLSELKQHDNLQDISIYKFESKDLNFPNIKNKHVSEATYYRLYINKYLPKDIESVVYLDSDILCLNNPLPYIDKVSEEIKNENLLLSARTEHLKNKNNKYIFERLNLKSSFYFNGGVLVINYKKWLNENIFEKLQDTVKNNTIDLLWWDQDILNQVIDGDYKDLNFFSNFKLSLDWKIDNSYLRNEVIFLHYQGKLKPWNISGLIQDHSNIYQDIYLKTNYSKNNYHLIKENSLHDLYVVFRSIFNRKLFKLNNPLKVILKVFINIVNE